MIVWSFGILKEAMMLSEIDLEPGAAPNSLLLSESETTLFEGLKDNLPAGWVVEFQAEAEMAWAAFVYCAEAPSKPMFTVRRWTDRLGLLAQWMDGTACSAFAFNDLMPVTSFILYGISEFVGEHHATVVAHAASDTNPELPQGSFRRNAAVLVNEGNALS